jgi:type VI secretion system protein ImpL
MKKLKNFFLNPIVISLIGLILFSLLIWYGGPQIKFGAGNSAPLESPVVRMFFILILVALWGLNNLRIQLRDNKQNKDLVEDLEENQASAQESGSSDQAAEELHQINQRFAQALSTLKKLKFSGRGKKKALYELPWYIIVGPPGAGKTTALVNSSLDFPLAEQFGKGALQGVGGTRNCDWWFTNEAVLVDTAGRYTTQDSHRVVDSSAWEGFLNLLKRNRRRRPINGVIVAISLHDLLIQTEEERIGHAKIIRTRLDELMERLEIRFPVYLMFTKADLVSGFTEFFEDLSKDEREQVWGVSLPNAPKMSQSPNFDFLSEQLRGLIERLYDRVLWRLHQERDSKRRGAIQGFPQQMENLNSILESFVRQTFIKNRFKFQPYLRGVYFSSGTQDGTPIDRMMSSVAANFGFAREAAQAPFQQGKSFFLGNLFREVIFPESELVGSNARYESFIRWAQRVAYVGLAGLTITVVLVWAGSITRHKLYMSEVQTYVDEFNEENKRLRNWNSDIRALLPTLNALAKASIVYDQDEHPWLSGMGLYNPQVDSEADLAYEIQLKKWVMHCKPFMSQKRLITICLSQTPVQVLDR